MPIDNMIKFIEQNKENLFPKISKKSTIINDDSQENDSKNYSQYNSLYKKLMLKKDEIFDNLMNNRESEFNKIIIHHNPHQRNVSMNNLNNNSTINLQNNNSVETNFFNNSSINKVNNSSNKFSNSSKNITNLSGCSNLLSKKNNDVIPIIFPLVCSSFAKYNSVSQSSRYQNIMDNFIKVKTLIENDKRLGKENELEYIKEFLLTKKIDKKHINAANLINFSKFLNCDKIPIDLNKSLKENILIGLYYDENKAKNKYIINSKKGNNSLKKKHKFYKDKLFGNDRVADYILKEKRNNYKSLVLDIPRQTKLHENEEDKSDYKLKDELQQEIFIIENEIKNKQNIIKQV